MTQFFKSKNNQNKYFIYLLISKDDIYKNYIYTKIIITKSLILHDLNYILINYENIIKNELEYKIIEHCILTYNFNDLDKMNNEDVNKNTFEMPIYPYDIFITNRVLLHSFLQIIKNKSIKDILFKEKIHIVSNMNYLKRIKDWSASWKKNRYSIEKYKISSEFNTESKKYESTETYGNASLIDSIFSINTLSQYYFNIVEEDESENKCQHTFKCKSMQYEEKSLFERSSERPNTDLIEECTLYFEEDKQIKFV